MFVLSSKKRNRSRSSYWAIYYLPILARCIVVLNTETLMSRPSNNLAWTTSRYILGISASFLYDHTPWMRHWTTRSRRSLESAGAIGEGAINNCYLNEINPDWFIWLGKTPAQKKMCSFPNAYHCKYSRGQANSMNKTDLFSTPLKSIWIESNPHMESLGKISAHPIEPLSFKLPFNESLPWNIGQTLKNYAKSRKMAQSLSFLKGGMFPKFSGFFWSRSSPIRNFDFSIFHDMAKKNEYFRLSDFPCQRSSQWRHVRSPTHQADLDDKEEDWECAHRIR